MQSGSFAFQNIKRESKTKELKQERKKTVTLFKKKKKHCLSLLTVFPRLIPSLNEFAHSFPNSLLSLSVPYSCQPKTH